MTKNTFVYKNAKITYLHNTLNLDKSTILCLHGFLENKAIFNFLFEDTYFDTYNLIAIDLLGHYESECIGFIHTMEDQAQMIHELVSQLKLKKINIIGHSLGGYVALAFYELYQKKVAKICLLNSTANADNPEKRVNRLRGIELVKKNTLVFIQMAIANLFDEKTRSKHSEKIEWLKQLALANKTQGLIANIHGMMDRKDRVFLLEKKNRVFYISGIKDNIMPIENTREEVALYKNKFYEIDGFHMLWLENPEIIKKILKENL